MLEKKSIFSVPVLLFAFFFTGLFYSCSEDPVTSQVEGFDSARFNVRIKTLNGFEALRGYTSDTSNIYLIDPYTFYHYNGSEFVQYFYGDNFFGTSIGGFDNNNVYIGGEDLYAPNNQCKQRLKKWTGSGFVEIPFQDSTNTTGGLKSIFVKSPKEVWMVSSDTRILKYDGQRMTHYDFNDFDTTRISSYFLIDESDNTCCVRVHLSTNPIHTEGKTSIKFYKFINNNWIFYSYHVFIANQTDYMFPRNVGKKMIASKSDGLYEFNGIDYYKIININNFTPCNVGYRYQKTNVNNILMHGYISNGGQPVNLFHWNGKKWSLEEDIIPYDIYDFEYADSTFIAIGHHLYYTKIYFFTRNSLKN